MILNILNGHLAEFITVWYFFIFLKTSNNICGWNWILIFFFANSTLRSHKSIGFALAINLQESTIDQMPYFFQRYVFPLKIEQRLLAVNLIAVRARPIHFHKARVDFSPTSVLMFFWRQNKIKWKKIGEKNSLPSGFNYESQSARCTDIFQLNKPINTAREALTYERIQNLWKLPSLCMRKSLSPLSTNWTIV